MIDNQFHLMKGAPSSKQQQPSQAWNLRYRQNNCSLHYRQINSAKSKCKTRPDQSRDLASRCTDARYLPYAVPTARPQLAVCVHMGGWHSIIVCTDWVIHLTGSTVNIFSRHIPSHWALFGTGQRAWNSRALTPTHNLRDK